MCLLLFNIICCVTSVEFHEAESTDCSYTGFMLFVAARQMKWFLVVM